MFKGLEAGSSRIDFAGWFRVVFVYSTGNIADSSAKSLSLSCRGLTGYTVDLFRFFVPLGADTNFLTNKS